MIPALRLAGASTIVVVLLTAVSARAQEEPDTIYLKTGKTQTGRISSEDYDGVTFALAKGTSSIKWNAIKSIQFANARELEKALDSLSAGKLDEAMPALEQIAADSKQRPVIRHEALYHLALAQQRAGNLDKAIATYKELLKSFGKSRYLLPIGTNLVSAYLGRHDATGASKALDEYLGIVKSAGVEEDLQGGLALLRGRVLEEQQKYDQAQSSYEKAQSASGTADPDLALTAKLGVARCLQLSGKKPDAERRYRELAGTESAPNTVLAGAWNGLGDLALEDGIQKRDPDRLRDALFSYMRGVVLYVPSREDPTDELEHAIGGASKSFKSMAETETNPQRKGQYNEKSARLLNQLKAQFPGSPYANMGAAPARATVQPKADDKSKAEVKEPPKKH